MKPEILSFSGTAIPLGNLAKIASQGAGLSLTYKTDRSPIRFSEDAQYLIALANLTGASAQDLAAIDILRNLPRRYLDALAYTMIVACDHEVAIELQDNTELQVFGRDVGAGYLVLVTGPLSYWHDAVVYNLLTDERSFGFRLLMDKVLLGFEKIGLGELWSNYQKRTHRDQTFLLEHKK